MYNAPIRGEFVTPKYFLSSRAIPADVYQSRQHVRESTVQSTVQPQEEDNGNMPTPKSWLPRAREILSVLRSMEADSLDRAQIEVLFELQRRQAVNLMGEIAPAEHGKKLIVDRKALISYVANVERTEEAVTVRRREVRRDLDRELAERRAVRQMVEAEGRRVVEFPVTDEILRSTVKDLPPGAMIERGRITLDFNPNHLSEACQLLYRLAMALLNDFPGFECTQRPDRPSAEQLLESLEADRLSGVLAIQH